MEVQQIPASDLYYQWGNLDNSYSKTLFGDKEKHYFKIGTAKDKFRLPQLWLGDNTKPTSGGGMTF